MLNTDDLIVFTAKYLIVFPLLALVYLAIKLDRNRRFELLFLLIVGGLLCLLFSKFGSHIYSDPRPYLADHVRPLITSPRDDGFPSDHTLLSSLVGFVALVFYKRIGLILLAVALIIGTARIAAGVHHAPDVAGGFIFAGVAVLIAYQTLRIYRHLTGSRESISKSGP